MESELGYNGTYSTCKATIQWCGTIVKPLVLATDRGLALPVTCTAHRQQHESADMKDKLDAASSSSARWAFTTTGQTYKSSKTFPDRT